MPENRAIYYVGDPMCSWCWGFRPVLAAVKEAIPADLPVVYVMGGLAEDSDQPMPEETREYVKGQWQAVMEATGVAFNWDFWEVCRPRRSTYPACRAVICAGFQREDAVPEMYEAIQRAYYEEARNPSDTETLMALASELSPPLDVERFADDLVSGEAEQKLQAGFTLRRSIGVREFPSLVLSTGSGEPTWPVKGWADKATVFARMKDAGIPVKREAG